MVEGFNECVCSWWDEFQIEGCGTFVLAKKIANLRKQLKHWAKFGFGSIKLKKMALLYEIQFLDTFKESHSLIAKESIRESSLRKELRDILKQEEAFWKQRERMT
ncbi:hypothetical protein IHE45_07G046400 [Dioscorea alata]|uniref:Uncharacterized protein n=1 Tax=Dioscorea alata TaxID=55571 RepID=A0ACB7VR54_DIOAL|nr:hypothetical protein IHE45_07G046400 [Dioscorea alata]